MASSSEAYRLRLRAAALTLEAGGGVGRDKPDSKRDVFADLGSPVSPLRLRATPSSSSSSAGSAKSPALCNAAAGGGGGRAGGAGSGSARGSHSGELLAESGSGSNPPRPPGHRRSGSGPLIFSGGSGSSGGGGGGGGGSTAGSPLTNALHTGNICAPGCVAAVPSAPRPRAWPNVLGFGTGHYGPGTIMWGGMAPARSSSIDAG